MEIYQHLSNATRILFAVIGLAAILVAPASATEYETWPELKEELYDKRIVTDGTGSIKLEAPYRAEDAAIVPISVRIAPKLAAEAKSLTLIVDENPVPVAAEFAYGPAAGVGERFLATRLRINAYSHVRAIVETTDGRLLMTSEFVKAAGGCSAPALKDADAAQAQLGKIRLKALVSDGDSRQTARVMIRHPQYSGFQMNQFTGYYIPAEFITDLEVKSGDDTVFTMTGGISLSEDPNLRFTYDDKSAKPLSVVAKDNKKRVFTANQAAAQGS